MRIFLISGEKNHEYKQALDINKDIEVAGYLRNISSAIEYFSNYSGIALNTICIFEEGINTEEDFEDSIFKFFNVIVGNLKETRIMLFCNNTLYLDRLHALVEDSELFVIVYQEEEWKIEEIEKQVIRLTSDEKLGYTGLKTKFKNLFGAKKEKGDNLLGSKVATKNDPYAMYDNRYSVGMRKVIAITGHGNSGKTSTAANLGLLAAKQNLNTVIVDLDIKYRGMNLYFSEFGEMVNRQNDLAYSLVRCLIKPETYELNAFKVNNNLSLMALAYSIDQQDKMLDVINIERLIGLLSYLRKHFNLVIVDIPIEMLSEYGEIISLVDSIGICINNDIHSIIRSLMDIKVSIPTNNLELFKIKTKTILARYNKQNTYNGMQLSKELTMEIAQSLDDILDGNIAGTISYNARFNEQLDTGMLWALANKEYHTEYTKILDNLL